MVSLKRQLAKTVERLTGALIVHPAEIHQLPERLCLRQMFDRFGVDAVFDVGANEGQYATQLRRDVGFKGAIISFEPIPEVAERLRASAEADPLWFVAPLALDREGGPATFNVMTASTFSSLNRPTADQPEIYEGQNTVARQIQVMRSTVAAELPKWREQLGFSRPFLKMDTQGSDLAVVEGAGDAIQSFVGLQSELAVRHLYEGTRGFAEVLDVYANLGFRLSALVPCSRGHFPDLMEIDCIMYRADAA
ncbi:MAG: methyltransferase FkbM family [Phenylobacterium sp.]|jgi:FkbM family methyltransferase|nr:methyltransferase FkbM family [Phenylobacterium sp.]MDB5462693.1 methyltransferase FkbM family [Phenylobacterium sp.]MDB5497627.1 methyltransferase FkbM family [Phenylobacterium sp.]